MDYLEAVFGKGDDAFGGGDALLCSVKCLHQLLTGLITRKSYKPAEQVLSILRAALRHTSRRASGAAKQEQIERLHATCANCKVQKTGRRLAEALMALVFDLSRNSDDCGAALKLSRALRPEDEDADEDEDDNETDGAKDEKSAALLESIDRAVVAGAAVDEMQLELQSLEWAWDSLKKMVQTVPRSSDRAGRSNGPIAMREKLVYCRLQRVVHVLQNLLRQQDAKAESMLKALQQCYKLLFETVRLMTQYARPRTTTDRFIALHQATNSEMTHRVYAYLTQLSAGMQADRGKGQKKKRKQESMSQIKKQAEAPRCRTSPAARCPETHAVTNPSPKAAVPHQHTRGVLMPFLCRIRQPSFPAYAPCSQSRSIPALIYHIEQMEVPPAPCPLPFHTGPSCRTRSRLPSLPPRPICHPICHPTTPIYCHRIYDAPRCADNVADGVPETGKGRQDA